MTHTLRLLKQNEVEELYCLPQIQDAERKTVFSLNVRELKALSGYHTLSSKLLFILQLGFFRVSKRFYSLDELARAEAEQAYLIERYFPAHTSKKLSFQITKPTRLSHQTQILELFNYRRYSGDAVVLSEQECARLASIHARPSYVVREILRYFERERIIVPAYPTLQNLVGKWVQDEISRLESDVDKLLSENDKGYMDALLDRQGDFLHELTILKRDPRDFSLKEIKEMVCKRNRLAEFHPHGELLANGLKISDQNLRYFSSLVSYYSVYKISRMPLLARRLLLVCFIHVRHRLINDHLIKAFLYRIDKYVSEAKEEVKEKVYRRKISDAKSLGMAGELLRLFVDEEYIPDSISFKEVREKVFAIIEKDELAILISSLTEERIDEKELEWEQFDKMASKIRINLRPLVLAISFDYQPSSATLAHEIRHLKETLQKGKAILPEELPPQLFSQASRKYVSPGRKIIPSRYEFQLYRMLHHRLVSGDIFVADSLSYRSFDQDLIDCERWKKGKDSILASLGLPKLASTPGALLDDLEKELEDLYVRVNQRILAGDNPHIKFIGKKNEKWTLPYTKAEEPDRVDIFGFLPPIGLSTLLNLVDRHCSFSSAFSHALGRYVKQERNVSALLAALTACATNIGLTKMARNANVSQEEIHQTYRNFIRPETLKLACDVIADSTRDLPLFSDWHLDGGRIYSSSDGQKFGVSRDTYNARYSSKYFGLDKGIVSYTLNANHLPINSRIIGANEHESHFVLDILLDNTSETRPNIHTTDSHGTNGINFALLYLFDYVFAPRYRNLPEEARNIYCFGDIDRYENEILRPKGKIDRVLIEEEWGNILRIAVSLATKTTSQSTIVRKLSSYPRKNKTRKALGELDKALKSIHLLRYIDELEFRQHIQKALNRGESYHSLKRTIFYDNLGKFRVTSEHEQGIWSECSRLLALSIIYYNTFILSQIATRQSNLGLTSGILKETSPIQWKHVDMFGQFYFGDHPNENEIKSILMAIEKLDFTLFCEKMTENT